MAITPTIYIANSKYTYKIDSQVYCGGFADVFNIETKKEDIMYSLLDQINEGDFGLINTKGLIVVFTNHKSNNEDYNYFVFYYYKEGYSFEDYKTKSNPLKDSFGFIENRLAYI